LIAQHLTRSARPFDWVIVSDSVSMPEAVRMLDHLRPETRVGLAYSVDHLS
jgi:hypothetical protein